MKPHEVVCIISEPFETSIRDYGVVDTDWTVSVILEVDGVQHSSNVTFEHYEDARKLRVGDVFYR